MRGGSIRRKWVASEENIFTHRREVVSEGEEHQKEMDSIRERSSIRRK
jgi:hypothetical protein